MSRETKLFRVDCWNCGHETEIACTPPFHCGHCGAELDIQWHAEQQELSDAA